MRKTRQSYEDVEQKKPARKTEEQKAKQSSIASLLPFHRFSTTASSVWQSNHHSSITYRKHPGNDAYLANGQHGQ